MGRLIGIPCWAKCLFALGLMTVYAKKEKKSKLSALETFFTPIDTEFRPMARTHVASRKGPLDGAEDPPSFSAGMVNPAHSS